MAITWNTSSTLRSGMLPTSSTPPDATPSWWSVIIHTSCPVAPLVTVTVQSSLGQASRSPAANVTAGDQERNHPGPVSDGSHTGPDEPQGDVARSRRTRPRAGCVAVGLRSSRRGRRWTGARRRRGRHREIACLVEEFLRRARDAGARVLTGACLPFAEAVPYAPFAQILGQLSAGSRTDGRVPSADDPADRFRLMPGSPTSSSPRPPSNHW